MPLSGSAFWACLLPVEKTNLVTNSSFERGTAGWGTLQAGTIGTTSAFQQFGAWSGSIAPTSNGTAGAIGPTFTAGNGTAYTFSAYVRGQSGIPYRLSVGDSSGVNFVGSTTFTGGGTWHRYVGSWTEASGATRRLVLTKNADADTGAVYIDGAQIEVGSLTTYLDGDQEGCIWLGVPHNSTSIRSGTSRAGGSIVALADLGLKPDDTPGAGMPPLETLSQSFALDPGSEFLGQRGGERPFVLTCKPISGTTQQDYHRVRRTLSMALKADTVDPESPVRLWYTGGQGTVQIDAVLASGFEMGDRNGPMAEDVAMRLIAHDPYWYATTQEGTALGARTSLGSTNYMARRDPYGRWGTMGANGSTLQGVPSSGLADTTAIVDAIYNNGTIFFCGSFGSFAGTTYNDIGMYYTTSNTFGTLVGGTIGTQLGLGAAPVRALFYTPWGSLLVGGDFIKVGGTLCNSIGQWNTNGWGTWIGGTIDRVGGLGSSVRSFDMLGGTVFFGGRFSGAGGTVVGNVALWVNNAFGTFIGGTVSSFVRQVVVGLDNAVYVTGNLQSAGGTTVNNVARWGGASWGSMGTGLYSGGDNGIAITAKPDGKIVGAGAFTNTDNGVAYNIAEWNGVQWANMGSGLFVNGNINATWITDVVADPVTGDIYASGRFDTAGGLKVPDGIARWNGYAWTPLDIDVSGQGTFTRVVIAPDRTLFAFGSFAGTAQAAVVTQIVNTGMAAAYPTFKARNISGGTIRLYQLVNTLTGDGLYFNHSLQVGEEITLVTDPGRRSFQSSAFGNIFSKIVPGSNITSFRLMPGTNYISLFCDSGSIAASVYWTPRHDSIDGGTNY